MDKNEVPADFFFKKNHFLWLWGMIYMFFEALQIPSVRKELFPSWYG